MAAKDPKKPDKPRKKSGKAKFVSFLILIALAMPFMMASAILLIAGLVPTYVAYATDRDPEKSGAICVFAMNMAGITPFLLDLLGKGQAPANAFYILGDANNWLVILGAAAIGQLVIYAVPQAIASMSVGHADGRIKALRKNLDLLKESWGPDVATVRSLEQIKDE